MNRDASKITAQVETESPPNAPVETSLLDNGIVQGVIVTLIGAAIFGCIRLAQRKRNESKIVLFLQKPHKGKENPFRSTHAIASSLNLGEQAVRTACEKSNKIRRNQKEIESWCLK